MKKEQERPKIKLKVRQTDENLTNFFDENQKGFSEQNNFGQDANKNAAQKIIIHEQNKSQNEEKTEKTQKKRSIFQICAIILTVLLAIAIIVEIFVMVALKNGATDLKNKNDKLPQAEISTSISTQIWEKSHIFLFFMKNCAKKSKKMQKKWFFLFFFNFQ